MGWEGRTTRALLWEMRHLTAFLSPFRSGVFNMSASNTSSVSLLTYNRTENQEQRTLSTGGMGWGLGRDLGGMEKARKKHGLSERVSLHLVLSKLPRLAESWVWLYYLTASDLEKLISTSSTLLCM